MILNGVIALILRYFTEFDSPAGRLRHSGCRQTYNVRRISPSSHIWPKLTLAAVAWFLQATAELLLYIFRTFLYGTHEAVRDIGLRYTPHQQFVDPPVHCIASPSERLSEQRKHCMTAVGQRTADSRQYSSLYKQDAWTDGQRRGNEQTTTPHHHRPATRSRVSRRQTRQALVYIYDDMGTTTTTT